MKLSFLPELNIPKQDQEILLRVVKNPKLIMGLLASVFIFYFIGCETLFKGAQEKSSQLQSQIESQRSQLESKRSVTDKYEDLGKKLASLETEIATVEPGQSAKVKGASVIGTLRAGLKAKSKSIAGLTIDNLTLLSLEPGVSEVVNILNKEDTAIAADLEGNLTELKLWRLQYRLEAEGSYLSIASFLNDVVQNNPLLIVKSMTLLLDPQAPETQKRVLATEAGQISASTTPAEPDLLTSEGQPNSTTITLPRPAPSTAQVPKPAPVKLSMVLVVFVRDPAL